MERRGFRIPEKSGCVRGIVICAAVMFATQFFGLYIMLGGGIPEWGFYWSFPLRFYGNILLLQGQISDLLLPAGSTSAEFLKGRCNARQTAGPG